MKHLLLIGLLWPVTTVSIVGSASAAPSTSTLERISRQMYGQLQSAIRGLHKDDASLGVVVDSIESDIGKIPLRFAITFRQRLVGLIRAKHTLRRLVAYPPKALGKTLAEELEAASRRGLDRLLRFEIAVKNNYMIISGHLFATNRNLWLFGHEPKVDLQGYFFISVRIDAEIKYLLGRSKQPPTPSKWALERLDLLPGSRLLAVGIGDIDGDREQELLLLTRDAIHIFEWRRGAFVELRPRIHLDKRALRDIVPRNPVGSLVVTDLDGDGRAEILSGTNYHTAGFAHRWTPTEAVELKTVEKLPLRLPGIPLAKGPGDWLILGLPHHTFPQFTSATFFDWKLGKQRSYPLRGAFLSFARQPIKTPRHQILVSAVLRPDYQLTLHRGGPSRAVWHKLGNKAGIALAITDLDDDGVPELVQTDASYPTQHDRVTIWQLGRRKLTKRFESPRLAAIVGLACGDIDNDGQLEVVLISFDAQSETTTLHVLRRQP
ncbi:MAG: VCBS repeat-containing protein [Myxococcales bacterium]|nr:VCBS repeat-containing protein [Myxococcales bacterium]